MKYDYEVLIVGGGPAGLSAAMTLGRIGRKALVCDDDRPRNAPSIHVNNLPALDGIHPVEWRSLVRKNLEKYPTISFFQGAASSVKKMNHAFDVKLATGTIVTVKKIILAYGIQDRLPEIEGFKELWGKSVFHCAFCHGYEIRNERLGIIANGDVAAHLTPLIYNLSQDLILFTNGRADLSSEMRELLKKRNILLVEEKIKKLNRFETQLKSISFESSPDIERDALFLAPVFPLSLKSSIGTELGCEKNEMGLYKIGDKGHTSIAGVFAAGECTQMSSVSISSALGVLAGTGVVFELANEDFKHS